MAPDAPFAKIGVVGLGLIGGSIAERVRWVWPEVSVSGLDERDDVVASALAREIITQSSTLADLQVCDLVILATPVDRILETLDKLGESGYGGVLTDVGSTKRQIMSRAAEAGLPGFVGGHPMAGSAQGGLDLARADLFDGRRWVLVRGPATDDDVMVKLDAFVRQMAAEPELMSADDHDRVMAYVSHAPQILASALMAAVGDEVGEKGLAVAGPGLRDMTRLASSSPAMWSSILATNADYISEALHALIAELPDDAHQLSRAAWAQDVFERARRWRDRLEP